MPTHRSFPPPRYQTKQQPHPSLLTMKAIYIAIIGGGLAGYVVMDLMASSTPFAAFSTNSCNIKGNISINSRERIYHMPGQEYYAKTKISPQYGERWFCSEAEALAAGWRRAGR